MKIQEEKGLKKGWLQWSELLETRTFVCWPTGWPLHLWSLRYFWWTGGLETRHGEHEIGFYHNHGLRSFVVATAENPHPASCAALPLDPPHKFFWGSGNSAEEVQQSCNNHVEWWRLAFICGISCQNPISTLRSRVWPRRVHTETWSRLTQTVRGTVRTGSVSSRFTSAGRLLAGVYTRLQRRNSTRPPPSSLWVCAWSICSVRVWHVCVPVFLNVKSD